jgi:hypothetical protein
MTKRLKFEKDLKIDGKAARVIVLQENHETNRIVYIPLKSLQETDYMHFVKWQAQCPSGVAFMDYLQKQRHPKNMRDALVVYENCIKVCVVQQPAKSAQEFDKAATLEQIQKETLEKGVTADKPTVGAVKTVYMFRDPKQNNKPRIFSKDGNKPLFIKEQLDKGFELSDFAYEVPADATEDEIKSYCK